MCMSTSVCCDCFSCVCFVFFSSRRRHTRCALVTGVQTCALPIYWGRHIDPRVHPQKPELVKTAITPDYALGSHVAPLGLSFANGAGFPGFAQGAFVGEHGSWNRQRLAGYKEIGRAHV